jgi:predicted Fe-Mo cluster-binding NifX family protein
MMRVAVAASQDFATVSGHAGQARRWLLFSVESGESGESGALAGAPGRIELAKDQVFHHWSEQGRHPLDGIAAIITTSAGDSFLNRMRRRGVAVVLTGETDPARAVAAWLADTVTPPKPRPIGRLICKLHDLFSRHRR